MHTTLELLDQPVERAARLVALDLLDAARKKGDDLDPADPDALHDFRVAVRRLRSWLRGLRPWLRDSTPKRALRRLEKTARLTGDSRDAEVHLVWLRAQRGALSVRQRHGLSWLIDEIEADKTHSDHFVSTKGSRAFDRARTALERKLPTYRASILDDEAPWSPFADVMAGLLRDCADRLSRRLAKMETVDDEKAVHRARLAGKRLRYLLEPIAEDVDGGALVAELEQLQDILGECHDGHVFARAIEKASKKAAPARMPDGEQESDPTSRRQALRRPDITLGLLALAGRLRERGQQAFAEAKARWPDAETFVTQVDIIARSLSSRSQHDTATAPTEAHAAQAEMEIDAERPRAFDSPRDADDVSLTSASLAPVVS